MILYRIYPRKEMEVLDFWTRLYGENTDITSHKCLCLNENEIL